MMPTVVPTSTSPSAMTIFRRTPSDSASTSWVTLSVSSSYSGSPFATASPSVLSQRTIVPDSMPCPSLGSLTSEAIELPARDRPADRGEDVVGVRNHPLLHPRSEREGRELRADPLDRSVEPVERPVLDHGGELRPESAAGDRLVGGDAPRRLLHRVEDRLPVEREERARVDDL